MDNNNTFEILALPTVIQVMIMGMLSRSDRENLARASETLRDILNRESSLNRWITDETRSQLQGRAWWLQGLDDSFILTDLCRFPGCTDEFSPPLDADQFAEDYYFFMHEQHMKNNHPEMWELIEKNLKQNKLPYTRS